MDEQQRAQQTSQDILHSTTEKQSQQQQQTQAEPTAYEPDRIDLKGQNERRKFEELKERAKNAFSKTAWVKTPPYLSKKDFYRLMFP
jgi:hypothetical protein